MATMLQVRTRHRTDCRHKKRGRGFTGCMCPKWVSGTFNDKPYWESLDTVDYNVACDRVRAIEMGEDPLRKMTISLAIEKWKASLPDIEMGTQRKYWRLMRQFEECCKKSDVLFLSQVTLETLDAFYQEHKVSARTKVHEIETFRGAFKFWCDRKWASDNPAKKIIMRGITPNEVVPYTQEEIIRLLAACEQVGKSPHEWLIVDTSYVQRRSKAMILLLWQVAPRIGDAYRLRRDAIRDGVLTLHASKNGNPIIRRLSPELLQALEALPVPNDDISGHQYFFWNGYFPPQDNDGGKRFTATRAWFILQPTFEASGVEKAHAHRFRHTLACEMLKAGATMAQVALALGDTVQVVSRVYAKYDKRSHEIVDDLIEKAQRRVVQSATIRESRIVQTVSKEIQ